MNQSIDERLAAAREIVREAGALARCHFHNLASLTVEAKGHQDPVSEADRAVERLIVERIRARFPQDTVLGEEYGGRPGRAVWVIDPIDGTANFLRGLPFFCVSIAFVEDGVIRVGVIFDPVRDELFSAREGGGACCNDRPIRVSRVG
ncbi:MAG: inositol monophosphatase, partial [Candidatus Competibacteraceae bacterium]|nr:inositol monophosphatase [Candidatus Competibacteraceae bacterium]